MHSAGYVVEMNQVLVMLLEVPHREQNLVAAGKRLSWFQHLVACIIGAG